MTTTNYNWQARLGQVTEELVETIDREFAAGRISEKAVEKINHHLNVLEKFEKAVERMAADRADMPGELAPPEHAVMASPTGAMSIPEITLQNLPNMKFVKTSFGKVNLDHVSMIDEKTKTLYIGNIQKSISEKDVKKIIYHTQFYQDK